MDRVFNFLGFGSEELPTETDSFVHSNLPPRWIPTQYVANKKIMEKELLQNLNLKEGSSTFSTEKELPTTSFSANLMAKSELHRSLDDKVNAKLGIHNELLQKSAQLRHVPKEQGILPTSSFDSPSSSLNYSPASLDYNPTSLNDNISSPKEEIFVSKVQNPTVVHEHVHPVTKEVIQPVIYREREQTEIQQIVKNLHQTDIQPTVFLSKELPAETREIVYEGTEGVRENLALPSVEVDSVAYEREMKEPIIQETIHKRIIKEIQPVIERDVMQTTVIKETLPIYERIVEAPSVTRELLPMKESEFIEKNGDITVERWEGMSTPPVGMRSQ